MERMFARRVRAGLIPALMLATTTTLVAASGAVAYSEHAVVTLFVAPQRVHVENVAVASTPLVVSVTESQEVTSTQVAIPASAASGRVTFMCSPMTLCPNGYTVAAGTVVESAQGVQYRTLSTVSFPSCAPSSPVTVTALYSGSAGNASAGEVVYARVPGYIHVTNPWPITGGADARSLPVVQQSSVDAAVKTLMSKVNSELPAQLQAQADGLSYVTTGAASFTTGGHYRVGDHAPAFTVQVTGTLSALAFPATGAQALVRQALAREIPSGYQLAPEEMSTSFTAMPASASSDAAVMASASGDMIPAVDVRALADGLRGQSVTAAGDLLRRASTNGTPQIRMSPVAMPYLPMVADHISVLIVVVPETLTRSSSPQP